MNFFIFSIDKITIWLYNIDIRKEVKTMELIISIIALMTGLVNLTTSIIQIIKATTREKR